MSPSVDFTPSPQFQNLDKLSCSSNKKPELPKIVPTQLMKDLEQESIYSLGKPQPRNEVVVKEEDKP
jgi:hypothetical protein